MAAEITYWSGSDRQVGNSAGRIISSETRSTSGSSAQSGATPPTARLVSVNCTSAAIRIKTGANPTAAAGDTYIEVGERVWFDANPGELIAAINA